MSRDRFDVAVIGAGAAGMMAAAVAGQRGLRVVLIDHAERLAEKIRISGGGRCNFTNLGASPAQFLSRNPDFCRSALRAYGPQDFLDLLRAHGVSWHEKHRGQLFCDDSSESVIQVLRRECDAGGVAWRMPCGVQSVAREGGGFALSTDVGPIRAAQLVLATGGMAIPQMGATDFSLRIARQFGLRIVEPRPALVPLTLGGADLMFRDLSGVATEVIARCNKAQFREAALLTHRGLSGPAILQISSYWRRGDTVTLDFLPGRDATALLLAAKRDRPRATLATALADHMPQRLAAMLAERLALAGEMAGLTDKALRAAAARIGGWAFTPNGSEGYAKAEVTAGGVDTAGLSSQSMAARTVPGLHVIGEAVDVTGWLGGYNFQWAWASGRAAGEVL